MIRAAFKINFSTFTISHITIQNKLKIQIIAALAKRVFWLLMTMNLIFKL